MVAACRQPAPTSKAPALGRTSSLQAFGADTAASNADAAGSSRSRSIGSSNRGVEGGEAITMSGRSYQRCREKVVGCPSSFPDASRKARRCRIISSGLS
jgi:hypothetical protein